MAIASNPLLASSSPSASDAPVETPIFVAAALEEFEFFDAPIDPDWILSGTPKARAALHSRSVDDAASTTMWDCTAGRFRWHFGWEETVFILEGQVHVTAEDGTKRTLVAGDVAYFAAGTWAVWEIDTYVRKLAFCRRVFPSSLQFALKLRDRMRGVVKVSVGAGVATATSLAAAEVLGNLDLLPL
ncbi:cupin domain-containing protein [Oryzibacter oryziterrae]|uniref:cupin domain-containing protein n=1 Tax=Oryzibacter oryziterrae TaxID=2766474 RepID=UPI001F47D438|nr:cupin domain-containing protein [Oryzibacter oryziterrae]